MKTIGDPIPGSDEQAKSVPVTPVRLLVGSLEGTATRRPRRRAGRGRAAAGARRALPEDPSPMFPGPEVVLSPHPRHGVVADSQLVGQQPRRPVRDPKM